MSNFEIHTDLAAIRAQVQADSARALPALTEQILKDCNSFCKQDQSVLINSAIKGTSLPQKPMENPTEEQLQALEAAQGSDLRIGNIIWDMPYAAAQYYLPTAVKDTNAKATSMWCDKAYDENHKAWNDLLQKLLEGNTSGNTD